MEFLRCSESYTIGALERPGVEPEPVCCGSGMTAAGLEDRGSGETTQRAYPSAA
jgi:hypothetical protein